MSSSGRSEHLPAQLKLENQVCFPLYSASNRMVRAYRPFLATIDLTYLQYLVMMVLWERKEIGVSALGRVLNLDSGTLTPLLKRLECKGLVVRARDLHDERARLISLTEHGHELGWQALEIPKQVACSLGVSLEELQQLKVLCEKIMKTI